MSIGKTIALTRQTFVGKVMSLLFNMLSRLVIAFLARSKRLLISWLQSPSAVIFGAQKIEKIESRQLKLQVMKSLLDNDAELELEAKWSNSPLSNDTA